MKIKNINLNRSYKNTKLYKNTKKLLFVISMSTLIGCGSNETSNTKEPTEIETENVGSNINDLASLTIENIVGNKEYLNETIIDVDTIIKEFQNKKIIALTFDDGPSKYTEELIEILNENNANATFFVLGSCVEKRPEVLVSIYESGNEIAIHGYSHTLFKNMSIEEIQGEIDLTRQIIETNEVECSNLVRPPGGSINSEIVASIDSTFIIWNVDTRDWESRDVEKIKEKIIGQIEEGDIILLHDIHKTTIEAMKEILPELSSEYRFVTVSELFSLKQQEYEENKIYYKVK